MRTLHIFISIMLGLVLLFSCAKEQMIDANPDFIVSFQRDGEPAASAGTAFYVIPIGSGEFFTLYDGKTSHVWGEKGSFGTDLNLADSMAVTYANAGTYTLTLVTTSTGDFGNEFERKSKSVEINVVDTRNSFKSMVINKVSGNITKDNEILFYAPDVTTDFLFTAQFTLDSDSSKAYVNGVEQVSKVTQNDFSQPVVYTIRSLQGTEKSYTVRFVRFPSSAEKQLLKFSLGAGGFGEAAVIDEANKTVSLTANYASTITAVKLVVESSAASSIFIDGTAYSTKNNYDISGNGMKLKVVAQNKTEAEYSLNVVSGKSVNSFTFTGLVPEPVGRIDYTAKTITIDVLNGTDIKNLVAKWDGSLGKVTVGSIDQSNGVTKNDFSAPVTYTFYKGSTAGDSFKVTVNVK